LEDGTARTWKELDVKSPRIVKNVRDEIVAYLNSMDIEQGQRQKMIERIQDALQRLKPSTADAQMKMHRPQSSKSPQPLVNTEPVYHVESSPPQSLED